MHLGGPWTFSSTFSFINNCSFLNLTDEGEAVIEAIALFLLGQVVDVCRDEPALLGRHVSPRNLLLFQLSPSTTEYITDDNGTERFHTMPSIVDQMLDHILRIAFHLSICHLFYYNLINHLSTSAIPLIIYQTF